MREATHRTWIDSEYTTGLLARAGLTQDDFVQLHLIAESDTGRILVVTSESFTVSPIRHRIVPNLFRINERPDGKTEYYFNRLEAS